MRERIERRLRLLSAALTAGGLLTAFSGTVLAGQWQQDTGSRWYYENGDGSRYKSSWQWIDGNQDGTAECYYFDADGWMLADTVTPDQYTVDASGAWTVNGTVITRTGAAAASSVTSAASSKGASVSSEGASVSSADTTVSSAASQAVKTSVSKLVITPVLGEISNAVLNAENDAAESTSTTKASSVTASTVTTSSGKSSGNTVVQVLAVGDTTGPVGSDDSSTVSGSASSSSSSSSPSGSFSVISTVVSSVSSLVKTASETVSELASNLFGSGKTAQELASSMDMMSFLRKCIGVVPYRYGGTSLTSGTDCSGFIGTVLSLYGKSFTGRSASDIYDDVELISASEAEPGDIVMFSSSGDSSGIYHAGFYSGDGKVISATNSRRGWVFEDDIDDYGSTVFYGRLK